MAEPTLQIIPVRDKAGMDRFIRLPFKLYRDDPHWVPPLIIDRRGQYDPASNGYFDHAEVGFFLAVDNGRPVGRITAQRDALTVNKYDSPIGHFGVFDCVNDPAVAQALLDTAQAWLAERGCREAVGPFSLSIHGEIGVLVDGFDTPPTVEMGHHPAYLGALIEQAGFDRTMDVLAYRLDLTKPVAPALTRMADKARADPRIQLRNGRLKQYDQDFATVIDIYNDAWADNWMSVPVTDPVMQKMAKAMRPIIAEHCIKICTVDGEPAAAMVILPDVNSLIADFGGRLLPFNWLKLLYRAKLRYPARHRVFMMGVKQTYRQSLIGGALAMLMITDAIRDVAARGGRFAELSWILETNREMRVMAERLGADPYKTYRMYRRSF